ncbi:acid phosphatase [Actinoplanes sp. SE50]|uniref:HAD family acid phosphatase n=1 Tax=unclassified Actinoplanes TaxID=2626549 RepID=UPI00023EC9E0|nr:MULTISPECIES: HAD family acid phosphatase [unclassified Actinoplanes]AEV86492.1 acid phosphatase [Actinoplanes sp. SE50/110]ATO84890.1 acid phosphatase [Actinoplanes sp. SE50]SLM02299.1 acid phosphatase [Actinoplanes sp. SE50/110]
MRRNPGPGLASLLACASLALALPAAAQAAPATPAAASGTPASAAAAQALPPYGTWISDVTAVTGTAQEYLDTRLPDPAIRAAIVLDIDNTALETTYHPGLISPATAPVLALARQAEAAGAAVFFVTARPQLLAWQTRQNLRTAGYPVTDIYLRPWFDFDPDATLKTNARIAIENRGYRIVANVGNNVSDLQGGHADRTFKLPDYNGQLS